MAVIGQFTKCSEGYLGAITTLSLRAEAVRIVALEERVSATSPSHRVYAGDAEIGVAWPKTDRAGNDYLNLKIDDPILPAPIYPTLVQGKEGAFVLVWSRATARSAE